MRAGVSGHMNGLLKVGGGLNIYETRCGRGVVK